MAPRRLATALLTVCVLAVTVACGSDAGIPDDADQAEPQLTFYRPPTVLADGSPGELLSQQPATLDPAWPGTGMVVRYVSTTPTGDLVPVTGVLLRPLGEPPPEGFPVVVWAHGSVGLGDPCAPSRYEPFQAMGADEFLRRGYVVVAPDYEGLGVEEETHPYLVGEATGNNILDAARAARSIDGGNRVVVFGASQGGNAALFSRSLADRYAPELELLGIAAAAPVTDVATFLLPGRTDPNVFPFLAEAILAWSEVYEEPELEDLVVVEDAEAVRLARSELCTEQLAPPRPLDEIFLASPGNDEAWVRAAEVNSVDAGAPGIPVLLTHGDADPLVPIEGTVVFHQSLCDSGESVRFLREPDWLHASAWIEPLPEITAWVSARFDGDPAPSDCPPAD